MSSLTRISSDASVSMSTLSASPCRICARVSWPAVWEPTVARRFRLRGTVSSKLELKPL
jgi:hypothetical protein